jgi:TrmH RNA methyltransferase
MPYRLVTPGELEKLSGTAHHQGVVAMVEDTPMEAVSDELLASWSKGISRIVVLDRVGDDHNLGSIARSAAFFGWTAMVIGRDSGSASLTTSAYRVARGALERIRVYSDETAARFLQRCRGRITTIGADHRGTLSLKDARSSSTMIAGSLALVLGNEETGLSSSTRSACGHLVRVDGSGIVESLNVSQAAAVFLYELR